MTKLPRVGLSLAPEEGFRAAASPLFEAGLVDVLEWSADVRWGWGGYSPPGWVDALCDVYSEAGALYGHGVTFSALSARWEARQERWLQHLKKELQRRKYVHFTEHVGFMSARGFLPSAPLPMPMTEASVRIGREAFLRLADVVGEPIGVENLAPTLSPRDAEVQGEFIEALVGPQDGFVLLDLHNVYCQSECLGVPVRTLIDRFPLDRVRELHVAGGSFFRPPMDPDVVLRCDTHNGPLPEPLFDLVRYAMGRCKNLEVVILERFMDTLADEAEVTRFRNDFLQLKRTVETFHD